MPGGRGLKRRATWTSEMRLAVSRFDVVVLCGRVKAVPTRDEPLKTPQLDKIWVSAARLKGDGGLLGSGHCESRVCLAHALTHTFSCHIPRTSFAWLTTRSWQGVESSWLLTHQSSWNSIVTRLHVNRSQLYTIWVRLTKRFYMRYDQTVALNGPDPSRFWLIYF